MGDFERDTRIDGGDGRYTATPIEDWRIWGPMGGYVASIALRAAAAEAPAGLTPASFSCQYFAPPIAPVDIRVETRRASRRTAALAASITQNGAPILDAQTWFAAESELITHDHARMHPHGHPDDHRSIEEYDIVDPPPFPFWDNFEGKPLDWIEDWENFEGSTPEWAEWLRFVPPGTFDDPIVEACRVLLLADLPSYPSATRAHPGNRQQTWVVPNLDLAVQIHRLADLGEWLLTMGTAPVADRGLIGFRSEVWTAGGVLAASGAGQLLCRMIPNQPR